MNFFLPIAGFNSEFTPVNPSQFCQLRNVGVQIVVTVVDGIGTAVNIRNAGNLKLKFQLPSEETVSKTATLYTNGLDGSLKYTTLAFDLSQTGVWRVQAQFTLNGLKTTSWGCFQVGSNINNQ